MGNNSQPLHTSDGTDKQNSQQIQIPMTQKRQGTGQKIAESDQPSYIPKAQPQTSSGYAGNHSRLAGSKYEEILASRTNSVYAGVVKPTVQTAVTRASAAPSNNYNSTSAAGYRARNADDRNSADHPEVRDSIQNNRNLLQNLQGK